CWINHWIKGIEIKQNAKKEEEKPKPKQADAKPDKPKQADAKPNKPQEIMILVDDAGGAWARIDHSPWNGCTLADFVMLFFLFIVGVAIALALKDISPFFVHIVGNGDWLGGFIAFLIYMITTFSLYVPDWSYEFDEDHQIKKYIARVYSCLISSGSTTFTKIVNKWNTTLIGNIVTFGFHLIFSFLFLSYDILLDEATVHHIAREPIRFLWKVLINNLLCRFPPIIFYTPKKIGGLGMMSMGHILIPQSDLRYSQQTDVGVTHFRSGMSHEEDQLILNLYCYIQIRKLKKRIHPRDITINIGKGAPVPECSIPGERWKEIKHDNTVTWLAFWNDPINPKKFKYVFLAASSSLKCQSDKEKYEKARLLKEYIENIRVNYAKDFTNKDVVKRQSSCYLSY
ncbi:hypothetical protein IFM89_035337, partial [Coptis chinensis]